MAVTMMRARGRFAISTAVHAVLDYLTAGALLTLPRALGGKKETCEAASTIALAELSYTALSDHEGGLYRVIPLPVHLALDMLSGVALVALPFALDEEEDDVRWSLVGLGVMSIVAPMITRRGVAGGKRGGFVTPERDWVGSRKDGLGSLGTPVGIAR